MVVFPLHLCQCPVVTVTDPWVTHTPTGFGNTLILQSDQWTFLVMASEMYLSPWRPGGLCIEAWHLYQDSKMRAWDSTESGFPAWLSEVLPTLQPDVSLKGPGSHGLLEMKPEFGLISILKSLMEY